MSIGFVHQKKHVNHVQTVALRFLEWGWIGPGRLERSFGKGSQADCAHAIPFSSLPAVLFVADIIFGYLDQVNWAALELYLVLVLPRGQATSSLLSRK